MANANQESWSTYIVPAGWADVPPPEPRCTWCQAPAVPGGGGICAVCEALPGASGPAEHAVHGAWSRMAPLAKRLHVCIAHGVDPWTGQPVVILHEQSAVTEDGVAVDRVPIGSSAVVPRTSWDVRLAG